MSAYIQMEDMAQDRLAEICDEQVFHGKNEGKPEFDRNPLLG